MIAELNRLFQTDNFFSTSYSPQEKSIVDRVSKKIWRVLMIDTRRDSRIASLQMNKQPIREKLEVYLTADD
jgi:hypothetical protein